jgi:hypothetical protein
MINSRIQEGLQNMVLSVKLYKDVLTQDSSNIEAIACIGMHHFYTDQPEVALRFYRYIIVSNDCEIYDVEKREFISDGSSKWEFILQSST